MCHSQTNWAYSFRFYFVFVNFVWNSWFSGRLPPRKKTWKLLSFYLFCWFVRGWRKVRWFCSWNYLVATNVLIRMFLVSQGWRFGVTGAHRRRLDAPKISIGAALAIGVNNVPKIMMYVWKWSNATEVCAVNQHHHRHHFRLKIDFCISFSIGDDYTGLFEYVEWWIPYRFASRSLWRMSASVQRCSTGTLCVQ